MIYDLQRASLWKRISAFLFDGILLIVASVLFAWALSAALDYDDYNDKLNAAYDRYAAAYSVNFDLSLQEYEAMTPEALDTLNAAYAALSADEEAVLAYNTVIHLTILITSLGIFLGFAAMEFAVPLCLGNGQTLGKKIFGIGLMRRDSVRVDGRLLFIRTFMGKYAVETMVPLLIIGMIWLGIVGLVGTAVLLGLLLLQALMLMLTKERLLIHDALAATVVVDVASQMIFPDRASMIAYIEKANAEKAARQPY